MKTTLQLLVPAYILFSFLLYDWPPEYTGDTSLANTQGFFVKNNSAHTVYYKPESRLLNPGTDPNGAYPIAPGQTLHRPVDAVITPAIRAGEIYRVPTGSTIIIDEDGRPQPANFIALAATWLDGFKYGHVPPPDPHFASLANVWVSPEEEGRLAQVYP